MYTLNTESMELKRSMDKFNEELKDQEELIEQAVQMS